METRLVAYFDLLGFSSIIRSSNNMHNGRHEKILRLLSQLAESEGDYSYAAVEVDDKITRHEATPAISAFSDNVVFSFPTEEEHFGSGPFVLWLGEYLSGFFHQALQFGCLVRGAITVGELHHAKKVVFGPALVDAHELESQFARTPRILVSASAMEYLKRNPFVRLDDDGFFVLDYLNVSFRAAKKESDLHGDTFSRTRWEYFEKFIRDGIDELEVSKNLRGLQNWRWLLTRWQEVKPDIWYK